ncbi:hypothetical protein JRO89_XS13G0163200 [Xanthoceras sorbifolium]|uniref:Uncharacterized protein n=1 Tax=Xanthoceras sorbifolium TaxID=99658 RepID=A0ABQ8H8P5_9ROSI|nr:hypothetical protein JRO89_XS13G0163200 [Xanthoceras sorbifolium]
MGKRGGAKRAPNTQSGSFKHLSLREEKTGKKQTNPTNVKSKLKLEHLQRLAVWAGGRASVPSLAAFFGHRLAAENEALGLQPDPSLFSCQRFCFWFDFFIIYFFLRLGNLHWVYESFYLLKDVINLGHCILASNAVSISSFFRVAAYSRLLQKNLPQQENLYAGPNYQILLCRCETILQPGFNCTVRIEKNQMKARHRRKKHKIAIQNNVVYNCHFCSYRNMKRGTPKGHMKEICPPKDTPASKPECFKCTHQKPAIPETETRSKDEVTKVDEIALPAIAGDAPASNSPVTPVRTKITLEGTKRKRNKSGNKKPAESESNSAMVDAEKTVCASSKRRRNSWTSLKEIAERSEHDNSQNITNLTIPFSLPAL